MFQRCRALSVPAVLVALAGGLLASLLPPVAAASAYAANTVSVSGRDGVLYTRCHDYKFGYSIETSAPSYTWEAEAVLRDSDGMKAAIDSIDPGKGAAAGSSSALLCGSVHAPGRYKLTLDVTFYDEFGDKAGTESATDTLNLRNPHTRTSFTVDDRTPRWHQFLNFEVKSLVEGPKGYVPNKFQFVALEVKRSDGWRRVRGSEERVGSRGATVMKARWESRKHLDVRAITLADRDYAGSKSKAKTLG